MVSIQKIAPAPQGGDRKYVSTKLLKQYAAVAITYDTVVKHTPGYMGRDSHRVHGEFVFFDKDGKAVHELGPKAEWEMSISQKGRSLLDRMPQAPATILASFTERQGTGQFAGKSFNEMDEPSEELAGKMVEELERREAAANQPPAL